jgi:hypothetical protein
MMTPPRHRLPTREEIDELINVIEFGRDLPADRDAAVKVMQDTVAYLEAFVARMEEPSTPSSSNLTGACSLAP